MFVIHFDRKPPRLRHQQVSFFSLLSLSCSLLPSRNSCFEIYFWRRREVEKSNVAVGQGVMWVSSNVGSAHWTSPNESEIMQISTSAQTNITRSPSETGWIYMKSNAKHNRCTFSMLNKEPVSVAQLARSRKAIAVNCRRTHSKLSLIYGAEGRCAFGSYPRRQDSR